MAFALYRLSGHEARESVADVMGHNRVPLPLD
jgi:hypothetical protein